MYLSSINLHIEKEKILFYFLVIIILVSLHNTPVVCLSDDQAYIIQKTNAFLIGNGFVEFTLTKIPYQGLTISKMKNKYTNQEYLFDSNTSLFQLQFVDRSKELLWLSAEGFNNFIDRSVRQPGHSVLQLEWMGFDIFEMEA